MVAVEVKKPVVVKDTRKVKKVQYVKDPAGQATTQKSGAGARNHILWNIFHGIFSISIISHTVLNYLSKWELKKVSFSLSHGWYWYLFVGSAAGRLSYPIILYLSYPIILYLSIIKIEQIPTSDLLKNHLFILKNNFNYFKYIVHCTANSWLYIWLEACEYNTRVNFIYTVQYSILAPYSTKTPYTCTVLNLNTVHLHRTQLKHRTLWIK